MFKVKEQRNTTGGHFRIAKKQQQPPQQKEEKQEVTRKIPIDRNNEQCLLGHALNEKISLEKLCGEVTPEMFLYKNHRAIFESLKYLYDRNLEVTIDAVDAVRSRFVGGDSVRLSYLGELKSIFSDYIAEENYGFHIEKLRDDKIKDELTLKYMPEFAETLLNPRATTEMLMDGIARIKEHIENNFVDTDFRFADLRVVDTEHTEFQKQRELGNVFGSTGYERLDKMLNDGYSKTKMTVVAGRTGMGKSSFVVNSFMRLALAGVPVAIYNFEMDSISTYDRLVSIKANIPLERIIKQREQMTEEEKQREHEAKEELKRAPLYLYNGATQTMEGLRRDIRILKERHGVHTIAYDLFDKMKFKMYNNRSTADTINEGLKQIQNIGREFDVHQVLVVQVGRTAEKRKNKRPKLSELKDAGGYEERADNVLFLYRPEYYTSAQEDKIVTPETFEPVEIIIAKQRQGAGNVKTSFEFYPASTTISEPVMDNGGGNSEYE